MTPHTIVDERVSRRVSPLFFVLALVCFVFTFAGVSCNTAKAKDALSGLSQFNGAGSAGAVGEIDRCLDALQGTNIVSYSGFNLAFGGAPSQLRDPPATCAAANAAGVTPASSNAAGIGVQPLALAALIAVALGILAGLAAAVVRVRPNLRLSLAMLLAAIAFLLLLFNEFRAHTVITAKLNSVAAGSGAPFSVSDYFVINDGLAWILALVALAVEVVYAAATLMALPALAPVPAGESPPPPDTG